MAEIVTGEYEVILRKKYELTKGDKNTPLVPYYNRELKFKDATRGKFYHMNLYMEIRKDIKKYVDDEIAGKRFKGEFSFIKEVNDLGEIKQSSQAKIFLKDLYNAVQADPEFFTKEDLAEHMIDKPVLITINVEPDQGFGIKYLIKKIEPTREPEIQPSALLDELDENKDLDGEIYAI